jgi:hypothetical protein
MPYLDWKSKYQSEATPSQQQSFEENKPKGE